MLRSIWIAVNPANVFPKRWPPDIASDVEHRTQY
jgi:hypothetical protein